MLCELLNKHWFIKRFMLVYIAGLIAALSAFVSVAQALEPIKPNPMSAGTFITEPETCPQVQESNTPGEYDATDGNGVRYWKRTFPGAANSYLYFYQSGTVPGCTDASAAPAGTTITGVNGFKLWIAYTGLQTGIFHSPLVDANHGLIGYPTLVNTFTVDGLTVDLAYYTFAVNDFKNLAITPLQTDGGRLYLAKITTDDLSTIDSQEKLYDLIKSSSPVTTPHIATIDPPSGPVGTLVTITGSNFGSTQGSSTVIFGATAATVSSWSDTQIKATVPALSAGTYNVVVTTSVGSSNNAPFQIISSNILGLFASNNPSPTHPLSIIYKYLERTNNHITADITITNLVGTWFEVDINFMNPSATAPFPVSVNERKLPSVFLLGPFQLETFTRVEFREGEYVHFDATRTSFKTYLVLAIDLIGRGIFGVELPEFSGNGFISLSLGILPDLFDTIESKCKTQALALGICAGLFDIPCTIEKLTVFMECTTTDKDVSKAIANLITRLYDNKIAKEWIEFSAKTVADIILLFTHIPTLAVLADQTLSADIDGFVRIEAHR